MTYDPEARLRPILRQQADAISPAGDGLSRIQARVAARRTRLRRLLPALALGAAVVIAGAAFGIVSLTRGDDGGKQSIDVATGGPTTSTESPSVSPTATLPTLPANAVWPFTSASEAAAATADAWHSDPVATATSFVQDYLGMKALDRVTKQVVTGDTAEVSIGRQLPSESKQVMTATTVQLSRWQNGTAPVVWLVTGATDDLLKPAAPNVGDAVSSPLTVSGPGFGVDESMTVDVRASHAAKPLGTGHTSVGSGGPWSLNVSFTKTNEPVGMVVAWTASALDGAPARVAVVPVRFDKGTAAAAYPSNFVGIKDGRVAVFASRNGAALRWLTPAGTRATDPQVTDDGAWVYYLQGSGTCPVSLMRVAYAGGTPQAVVAASDVAVSGYGTARGGTLLAYVTQPCNGGSGWKLVARDSASSRTHTITAPTPPPGWVGNVAWSPDGTHIATTVQYGMSHGVRVYDAWTDTAVGGGTTACDQTPSAPASVAYRVDGTLLAYGEFGGSPAVVACGSSVTSVFTVPGDAAAALSVSPGGAILVTSADGRVWRWTSGTLTQLHPAQPLGDARW
jgi:hypothetical protein